MLVFELVDDDEVDVMVVLVEKLQLDDDVETIEQIELVEVIEVEVDELALLEIDVTDERNYNTIYLEICNIIEEVELDDAVLLQLDEHLDVDDDILDEITALDAQLLDVDDEDDELDTDNDDNDEIEW